MADIGTIADALVSELTTASDAGDFVRTFESKVLWANRKIKLEDPDKLRVDVAPISYSRRLHSRGRHLLVYVYHVGVRKRFVEAEEESEGELSDTDVKELVQLLDEIVTFFLPKQPDKNGRPLTDIPNAWILGPEGGLSIEPVIRWEDLEGLTQFSAFFEMTVQIVE